MKKVFAILAFCSGVTLCSAQGVGIKVNPQFAMEGKITSKKANKPLINQQLSVYGFDQVWSFTTGAYGGYYVDFSKNGTSSSPPQGIDGKDKLIFFYNDKRMCIISTWDIKFVPNGANEIPVVHWDVKL